MISGLFTTIFPEQTLSEILILLIRQSMAAGLTSHIRLIPDTGIISYSWYLTVNVIDSNGDAVDNARVVVQRSGGGVVFDDYTEEDGRFIIPLHEHETRQVNDVDGYEIVPLSDYTVTVSHEGSLLPERSVTMDRSRTVTFEFVTGEDTAAPIMGPLPE